jgi:Zn-dependent protease with chaperone function
MPNHTTTSNPPAGWVALTVVADVSVGPYALSIVEMHESLCDGSGLINAYYSPKPFPHVGFNAAALALPVNLRLAIAAHEVGHYALGHCGGGRCLQKEIDADRFAVQYVGLPAVRQALTTLRKTQLRHGIDPTEAEARLAALPQCPGYKPKAQKTIPGRKRRKRRK